MASPKATFHPALIKLREILQDNAEAKARGEVCGSKLQAMADRIAARAKADPTLTRGETWAELTEAPQDMD